MSIEGESSADATRVPERKTSGDVDGALAWCDVRYAVGRRGTRRRREILRGTSGVAHSGRLHGILGPSGSGKTTLLNILAGRMRERRGVELSGDVTHGGEPLHASGSPREEKRGGPLRGFVARMPLFGAILSVLSGKDRRRAPRVPVSYVEQDPKFFSNMTVRETLTLDARLLGGDDADVDAVLRRLGLTACADTLVGGDTGGVAVRGVGGGERRRLAIACETLGLRLSRESSACGIGIPSDKGDEGDFDFDSDVELKMLHVIDIQSGDFLQTVRFEMEGVVSAIIVDGDEIYIADNSARQVMVLQLAGSEA